MALTRLMDLLDTMHELELWIYDEEEWEELNSELEALFRHLQDGVLKCQQSL